MAERTEQLYQELVAKVKQASVLNSCASLLGWDERTQMPRGGVEFRAEQLSMLSGMVHEMFTAPRIGELLAELEQSELMRQPYSDQAANVRETRRAYDKSVKLPKELVEELTHTATLAQGIWGEARQKSDFKHFQPILQKTMDLKFKQAQAYGYKGEPYDALLDDYEPGATSAEIAQVFSGLRDDLVPLVEKIAHSRKTPDLSIIESDYAVDKQELFGLAAAAAIGYDFSCGRLDKTTHPFCTGIGPGDVRITTRYNPRHFGQAFFGILHEAGHGIYEQGLPVEHFGMPMGEAVSLGIHESQSRMWENLVGRSRPFWKHFFPRAQQTYPERLAGVSFEDFYFAINDVRPSFIRVEADEVTYNLHILLRFEIERAIMRNDLKVADIPAVWNEKFQKYFGIRPANDAEGCLQDIHWSAGLLGYFPTYALGNLYAAQFFASALDQTPDLHEQFEIGEFGQLKAWLRKSIHTQGKRYPAGKLVEVVTGRPLSHKPLIYYLEEKFSPLYGF